MLDATPQTVTENHFPNAISRQIWEMKYRLKSPALKRGDVVEREEIVHDVTVEDTWRRIATALAAVEGENIRSEMIDTFYVALKGFGYLPAGRITAGAGTGRSVTLFNCFVMGTVPDSMAGIFDMLKEAALTMQQGGGIGYDFSTVRPRGASVVGVGSDASGPLSFMDVWDAMCRTIMSAGSRRGAMMATMRCDHPDVEAFITAKHDPIRLRMFNMSVLITDPFMAAVKADADWDLVWKGEVWKTLKARDLWNKIMKSTYDTAEPGVIFIDRINKLNNLNYCETIAATNPCGEQALPPYGACLLGSINMAMIISNAFEENAKLDEVRMRELVRTAVRMMDNVVDASNFPLPQQLAEAQAKRRIGLGVTGLADALLMLGLRYGSDEAAAQTEAWMKMIAREAYLASIDLAKEKGPFPLFDAEKFCATPMVHGLGDDVVDGIREHGIRNALLTSIAPTGTISLYAGNVSSGIEPVFAYSYTRKVLQPDGTRTEEEVVDYAVQLFREKFGRDVALPDYFVNAQTLSPQDHVKMQAAAQKWIDNCISKTVNCPEDISFEDFVSVYEMAYETGCKGCTTYRPNAITGSVLTVTPEKKDEAEKVEADATPSTAVVPGVAPLPRAEKLDGSTYKIKWEDHAYYVTINDTIGEDGVIRPFEIFINTKNVEAQAWISALTLMISAVFRRGGDVSFVCEELTGVFDARGGQWMAGKGYVKSLVAAIGDVIEEHLREIGFIAGGPKLSKAELAEKKAQVPEADFPAAPKGQICPSCKEPTLIKMSGCDQCTSCGHSKCS